MLTDKQARNAKPGERPYKLFDAGGLYLLVKPSGYRSWCLKYRFGGKEKKLTFGPYPLLSLREARERRDEAKRALLANIDPARRDLKAVPAYTFRQAAMRWHDLQSHGWKPRHAADVLTALETEAFPTLGDLAVKDITTRDVRPIVEAMQDRGAVDQAHRMLMRLSRIFRLAIVDEKAETDPAAPLTAILKPVPKRKYPALTRIDDARAALKSFEAEPHWPATKLASRLLALTASRPGPVRFAQPGEFQELDGEEPVWLIPAAKLKLPRAFAEQEAFAFTIPLSQQAAEVVRIAIEHADGRPYIFPSTQSGLRPLTENTLSVAYKRSEGFAGRHVPHGWRSTFSTVMNERAADLDRLGDRPIIDLMLAHKPQGVEAAYNRSAYMPRRRQLAQEWADLLSKGLAPPASLLEGPRN